MTLDPLNPPPLPGFEPYEPPPAQNPTKPTGQTLMSPYAPAGTVPAAPPVARVARPAITRAPAAPAIDVGESLLRNPAASSATPGSMADAASAIPVGVSLLNPRSTGAPEPAALSDASLPPASRAAVTPLRQSSNTVKPAVAPAPVASNAPLPGFIPYEQYAKEHAAAPAPASASEDDHNSFVRGFLTSAHQLPELGGATVAFAGDVLKHLGADNVGQAMLDYGLDVYKRHQKDTEDLSKDSDSFSYAIKHPSKLGSWLAYGAGYTGGQAVESLAAMLAGALAGSEVPGLGNAAGAAVGLVARKTVERAVVKQAEKLMAEKIAKGVAEGAAKRLARKQAAKQVETELAGKLGRDVAREAVQGAIGRRVGRTVGAVGAAQGINEMQELGSVYGDARQQAQQEGRELSGADLARIGVMATAAAGVDTLADMVNLSRFMNGAKLGSKAEGAIKRRMKAGLREIAAGAAREGGTEAVQTVLERVGAGQPVANAAGVQDIVDSAALGVVGGGAAGAGAVLHAQPDAHVGNDGLSSDPATRAYQQRWQQAKADMRQREQDPNDDIVSENPELERRAKKALAEQYGVAVQDLDADEPPSAAPTTEPAATAANAQPAEASAGPPPGPIERAAAAAPPVAPTPAAPAPASAVPHPDAAPGSLSDAANAIVETMPASTETMPASTETPVVAPTPRATKYEPVPPPVPPWADAETGEFRQPTQNELVHALASHLEDRFHRAGNMRLNPERVADAWGVTKRQVNQARKPALAIANRRIANQRTQERAEQAVHIPDAEGAQSFNEAVAQLDESPTAANEPDTSAEKSKKPWEMGYEEWADHERAMAMQSNQRLRQQYDALQKRIAATKEALTHRMPKEDRVGLQQQLDDDRATMAASAPETLLAPDAPERDITPARYERMLANARKRGDLPTGVATTVQATQGTETLSSGQTGNAAPAVTEAAQEAATSPANAQPEPTPAQQEAGNFRMGHVRLHGLDVSIEIPKGGTRRGTAANGKAWERTLADHYGYIRGTKGADGEHVDTYVGPKADDPKASVYVVDQVKPGTDQFDEHKVMLGFANATAARQAYSKNFPRGLKTFGGMRKMTLPEFKGWLASGDMKQPVADGKAARGAASTPVEPAPATPATAPVSKGDRVRIIKGKHEGKTGIVFRAGRDSTGIQLDNGTRVGVSTKVVASDAPVSVETPAPVPETAPEKTGAQSVAASASAPIKDFGEKIGGARKDTAVSTGGRGRKKADTEDTRPTWQKRYEINQIVKSTNPTEEGKWAISDKRRKGYGDVPLRATREVFDTREEAQRMLPLIEVARNHSVHQTREDDFAIFRRVTDNKRVAVKRGFDTRKAALEYMATHPEEIINTKTSVGEEALPTIENPVRKGPERRRGDVKPAQFAETFGFRGVEFGNWNNQEERQEVMNNAYDGLLDLAELLDIPPRAISLNGELALAFGARGHGLSGARAHYEPGRVVMNLTKMQGSGALAHEWFHALDHYFGRQTGRVKTERTDTDTGGKMIVGASAGDFAVYHKARTSELREELRQAYTKLIDTMQRKATTYMVDSQQVEKFVGAARDALGRRLTNIREDLAREITWGRKNKRAPASAEQLAEFDALAERLLAGQGLELKSRERSKGLLDTYQTNSTLDNLSAILQEVRGRNGFAKKGGALIEVANDMQRYRRRLNELKAAADNPEREGQQPTSFRMEAIKADQGRGMNYWSTPHEMAARAFSAYVEDKLAEQDRSSEFLSYGSEGRFVLPIPELPHPFPQGEERKAIDKAFDAFFDTVKTRETEAGQMAMFQRLARLAGSAPARPARTVEELAAIADRIRAGWRNAPAIRAVRRFDDLPAAVRQKAAKEGVEGKDVSAAWHDGVVWLVADHPALVTDAGVERAIFHEVWGHYGLRALFGKDVMRALTRMATAMGGIPGIMRYARRAGIDLEPYRKSFVGRDDLSRGQRQALLLDELAAHIAQNGTPTLKQRLKEYLGAVKAWLRDHGFPGMARMSDLDLAHVLKQARDVVVNGKPRMPGDTDTAFQRTPRTATRDENAEVRAIMAQYAEHPDRPGEDDIRAAVQDYHDTERAYGGRDGYERARSAGRTKLTYRQWVQVRTQHFRRWFGDWEALQSREFLDGDPVSTLTGNEFAADGVPLTEKVPQWYADHGVSAVDVKGIGTVTLDKRAVSDSIAHGLGRNKSAAFAAVPDVLRNGRIIHVESMKGSTEGGMVYHVTAPIRMAGKDFVVSVMVKADPRSRRMYVHEVAAKEKLQQRAFKTGAVAAEAGMPAGANDSAGAIRSVLQHIYSVNPAEVSKVVDSATGEPLVVYHGPGTTEPFDRFDRSKLGSREARFFFTSNKESAREYAGGREPMAVFLNAPQLIEFTEDSFNQEEAAQNDYVLDKDSPDNEYAVHDPEQIKSATANIGTFSERQQLNFSLPVEEEAAPFYSQALATIEEGKGAPKIATATSWKQWLDGAQRRGDIKKAEREWLGLDAWLDRQDGKITREALTQFVRDNQVQLRDVVLGEASDDTKFSEYTLPGGENYRELLLTLPRIDRAAPAIDDDGTLENFALRPGQPTIEREPEFRSSHFNEPNILAHVRFDTRHDTDGKKVLFLEEIQSDWHQKGREHGYSTSPRVPARAERGDERWEVFDTDGRFITGVRTTEAATADDAMEVARKRIATNVPGSVASDMRVPDAPFKRSQEWAMLAFKRMARYAAEHGYDRIAWTTGAQQAERYDLSAQVDGIRVMSARRPDQVNVMVKRKDSDEYTRINDQTSNIDKSRLPDVIGKDLADRALQQLEADPHVPVTMEGVDLKVGGDGMKAFYDRLLPNEVNKWARKLGGHVGETSIVVPPVANGFSVEELLDVVNADGQVILTTSYDSEAHNVARENPGSRVVSSTTSPTGETTIVHSLDITPDMKAAALGGLPLFRAGVAPAGTPADVVSHLRQVNTWTRELTQHWGDNQPRVRVVHDAEMLPDEAKTDPRYTRALGFYDGKQVWLVAPNLLTRKMALKTLTHEAVGHYGVERIIADELGPDAWNKVESTIAAQREKVRQIQRRNRVAGRPAMVGLNRVQQVIAEVENRYGAATTPLIFAKETLAVMSEKGVSNPWLDRAIIAIRRWLRKIMPDLRLSDAELRQLLVRSDQFLHAQETYQQRVARVQAHAFDVAPSLDTAAFHRFFHGSRVVDAQGRPRLVYHGTADEFTVFDDRQTGSATGHATSPLGFFATESQAQARRYAENASGGVPADEQVMDLYMAIRKPYTMSLDEAQAMETPDQARAVRARLEREGYDGIHMPATKTWIAFHRGQIKSASGNVGTFDANHPDIRFSHPASISQFLDGTPVADIQRGTIPKEGGTISDRVMRYYVKNNVRTVVNHELGEVDIKRPGVKSSIAHGVGADKIDAFAAVPDIIRQGRVIDAQMNYGGKNEDRYVIAAPFRMGAKDYLGAVVIRRSANGQRFYLHEVALKEKLRAPFSTGALTSTEDAARTGGAGAMNRLLRDALAGKMDSKNTAGGNFSLPSASIDTMEKVMQDDQDDRTGLQKAKDWVTGKIEDIKPALLGTLQLRQLLEVMEAREPLTGAKAYANIVQRMDTDRNQLLQGAPDADEHPSDMLLKGVSPVMNDWRKWAYESGLKGMLGRKTKAGEALEAIMHDATLLGMDPARDYERIHIDDGRGKFVPWTKDLVKHRIQILRERARGIPGDDKSMLMDEVKRLKGVARREKLREEAWPALKRRFDALPEEAKQIYREVRDWYQQHADATEKALIARIEAMDMPETYRHSVADRIRLQFEMNRREGVYFPLNRNGEYWISYSDSDGAQGFLMLESAADMKQAEQAIRRRGWTIEATGRKNQTYRAKQAPSGTFVKEVIQQLQKAGVNEKVQNDIYEAFLKTLPEVSMRKHHIRRKSVPGFSADAMRAFAKNGFHGSYQLARLRWSQRLELILEGMHAKLDEYRRADELGNSAKASGMDTAKADALLGELEKRHERIMSPTDSQLANRLTSIGFLYFLGASPASALVNLTQGAQVTLPVLAARHGWAKAARVLGRTTTDAMRTGGNIRKVLKSEDERRALMELEKRGDLDRTQSHTLAAVAEGNELAANPTWERVMRGMSWMFHKAELVNREAAGVAAYRLARSEGKNFRDAVQYASDIINGTQFDYSAANRPRFMQEGWQKVLLQFKNYSVSMTWLMYRNLYQAFKGETPEVRRVARRTLTGVLGMTALLSGVVGLPIINLIAFAANAAHAVGGDDDEPWDFLTEFRAWLAEHFGATAASIIADGAVDQAGLKISSRVSLSNLWWRTEDRQLEGRDAYYNLLDAIAGPMGGIGKNWFVGTQYIREGHVWRGVERMMPTFAKNGMKAFRYASQGVNTLTGNPIVPDVSTSDEFVQALGFQPTTVAEQSRVNNAIMNYQQQVKERRQSLMNAYAMTLRMNAPDDRRAVLRQIHAFNRHWPRAAITGDTLRRSLRSRARYSRNALHGMPVDKRLRQRLESMVRPTETTQ